jgi:hypothetical protein
MRITISNGKIEVHGDLPKDGEYVVEFKKQNRTISQNKALHLFYKHLAEALNDAGYDMKKTLRQELDIPWSPYNVKEFLWRPLMLAMTGKKSTAHITTDEINKIKEVLDREIGNRTGVYVEFPSIEYLINELNK